MTEDEVLRFLASRRGLLDGVCVTGGEPLMQPDLPDFLGRVKKLGFAVKVDTNGSFPDRLEEILTRRLADYIAVDLKNSPEKIAETVGLPAFDFAAYEKSIRLLRESGVDYEFRTTVVREYHTVGDIAAAARWIEGAPRYYLQAFVDSGHLIGEGLHAVSKADMLEMQAAAAPFVGEVALRGV